MARNQGLEDELDDHSRAARTGVDSKRVAHQGRTGLGAFAEIHDLLEQLKECKIVIPAATGSDLGLLGNDSDRSSRNKLQTSWLARQCADWLSKKTDFRIAPALLPQSTAIPS